MKAKIFLLMILAVLIGCNPDELNMDKESVNQVLMLQVDYTTLEFEGGTEFHFEKPTDEFTIIHEYIPPADFGEVKLFYKELNELLFAGTIHWMGTGKMNFPEKLVPADKFNKVITEDLVIPSNGFENIFNPDNHDLTYEYYYEIWLRVQNLTKAREYLRVNPLQKVKVFLYTPSVGVGNPLDWNWIVYLQK
ncbi:MAG: hypothetical protein LLF81_11895 [Porphyromonadaceae bacterium]|nr:hypothetical protein [Porphyromonadaceae bacterium]